VDQCVLSFYDAIGTSFERVMSLVQNKPEETKAPWMTSELSNLKNRRNAAWKRYSKTRFVCGYDIFMERYNLQVLLVLDQLRDVFQPSKIFQIY
jgi:hypothetical protein